MERTLENIFPQIESGIIPLGGQVIVQIIHIPETVGAHGIILAREAHETEQFTRKTGKIIAIGPTAFKNKLTEEKWPGFDVNLGDYVLTPHVAGTRFQRRLDKKDRNSTLIHFVMCNDTEIRGKVNEGEVLDFENNIL